MRTRTGYSFKVAIGHIDQVLDRLIEIGSTHAPISDRLSTFGFNRWQKKAKSKGLKPVFGVEVGVVKDLGEKQPIIDHWTFWAKHDLQSINNIVALATENHGREPTITYAQAQAFAGVVCIAGERCILDCVDHDAAFISLSPSTPRGLYKEAKKRGFRFVAQSCNVYTSESDLEMYRLALGKRASTQTYPQHILSDGEWRKSVGWFVSDGDAYKAIYNRNCMLHDCDAKMKMGTMLVPERPATLKKMCEIGAKKLGINLKNKVYAARLKTELDLIAAKKFEDYFYIIADMVNWAKERMIVGPARGSSCGSLACYLLGITTIDPIPFDLIFERFIDVNRDDLPDIDIDFSDKNRHLVFEYAEEKYGRDRVARLGTVMMFQPRSAIKQVGGELDIPPWKIEKVLDGIIQRSGGDSRALQALADTLDNTESGRQLKAEYPEIVLAGYMEGHPSTAGQHAAGVIITNDPVTSYLALDSRVGAVMCDKKDAEDLNLLKIDALGLSQLSIFERTLELIGEKPVSGWLEKLPLDDKNAFEILNSGNFAGVFQFAGAALQSLTRQVRINHIEDIIAITALARPGPMATGGAASWVKRKIGNESVSYPHPLFKPYLEQTLGIVMYQEQVMQIGREIGDLSWGDVTALRKAMSKSLGKEYFNQFGDKWKVAAIKKGIPPATAEKVWDDICAYGSWAFNRSHSVAYGLVSYWCCWLKANHPLEFAAATLDSETDPTNQIKTLRELANEGIKYVAVDPDHSTDRWNVAIKNKKKVLVGPLTQIHGIGESAAKEIMDARSSGEAVRPALLKRLTEPKTSIGSLYPISDRIAQLIPDMTAAGITTRPTPIPEAQCGIEGQVVIIGLLDKLAPKDENEQVNIAKRGYAITGPHLSVNMFITDDTDRIFCKIGRYDYARLAEDVLNRGKAGKAIYAIKGDIPKGFRMISVKQIKYIGDME